MKMRSGEGLRNVDQIFEMRGRESFVYMNRYAERDSLVSFAQNRCKS
jgi:hypothetical protein